METEITLGGGGVTAGVVRVRGTVRRPTGAWTPTVHSLLRHLESCDFDAAPRVLGVDEQGREMLTYVEGEVPSSSSGDAATLRACPTRRSETTRSPVWRA